MKKRNGSRSFHRLAASIAVACGLAAAGQAGAVHLDPRGSGQVLLYPYYTVNKGQQTYVTVLNVSNRTKMADVKFREGYNGRTVMDFKLFLAPFDTWTGTVFALEDIAGEGSEGAAILTADRSCTAPSFWTEGHGMLGGAPYARFSSNNFVDDGGPAGIARTREGHIEIIAMADLTGSLAAAVELRSGVPVDCSRVRGLAYGTEEALVPTGGLVGSGAVINVGQGTYFSYRADALADFTKRPLLTGLGELEFLDHANDGPGANVATARVPVDGQWVEAPYRLQESIDAVSAVLMADSLFNEYVVQAAIGANSDWVVTFPTKRFYTDLSVMSGTVAIAPFIELFGENGSCVTTRVRYLDRESQTVADSGFPGAPPIPTRPRLCHVTNVLAFLGDTNAEESAVLGSRLVAQGFALDRAFSAGWARLDLNPEEQPHAMRASTSIGGAGSSGKVFHGLPAIGFWATNLVNNNVADGVMSNYSAALSHGSSVSCSAGTSACN
ncbi:MAG: hypothetical protein DI564_02495 [Rhodanobacter denitrificans]|uniref:Uncharacterized protein n=1 Tax=Rhodanobacter denitrificans TaxID=666685 RepID=A0A2W5KR51_9GAMM|nr:MAG: hypothetical protein DI564_02495 [Rhodanobacter denitrificans]